VRVRGGGAAQLATTVYRALIQAGVTHFTELQFYGDRFNDTYAASGDEAVLVDYANGHDLLFCNTLGDMTFYITMNAYGVTCTVSVADGLSWNGAQGNLVARASTAFVSGDAQRSNAVRAADSISGVQLTYGQEFSFNAVVGPRTREAGYVLAVNGRGAKVRGGGSAQAASTLYLAVRDLANVRMTEKHTYGDNYNQAYVTFPEDAIMVDYNSQSDFRFAYYGSGVLTLVMYETNGILFCDVYER